MYHESNNLRIDEKIENGKLVKELCDEKKFANSLCISNHVVYLKMIFSKNHEEAMMEL
jgi:hypothetical protein